jgi:sugar phosphate isomerase/epimerase
VKVGLYTFSLREMKLSELLTLARDAGVEAIELGVGGRATTPGYEARALLDQPDRLAELKELVAGHGMEICAFNSTSNPLHPDTEIRERYLGDLKAAIRLAAESGVGKVVTGMGCPGESAHSLNPAWVMFSEGAPAVLEWQWAEVAIPIWREIAAYAAHYGVRICIEVLPGTLAYNTSTFLRLRDAVGEAVGANLDPSHFFWQGIDPGVVARELRGCIYHAHAKDTVFNRPEVARNGVLEWRPFEEWQARSWSFCAMGDGHDAVFWRWFMTSLLAAGYDGPWCIEHEDNTLDARTAIRRNAEFLKGLL